MLSCEVNSASFFQIEYGDMQLIAEAYDLLKLVCGMSNDQLAQVFDDWNKDPGLIFFW